MLIDTTNQPKQIIPTLEEILNKTRINNFEIVKLLRITIGSTYLDTWQNPNYTPDQVVSAWGTDATSAFQAHATAQELLKILDQSYSPLGIPDGYSVDFNEDGSATVTKKD